MQQVSTARSSSEFSRPKPNKWNIIAVYFICVGLILNRAVFGGISAPFDSILLESALKILGFLTGRKNVAESINFDNTGAVCVLRSAE